MILDALYLNQVAPGILVARANLDIVVAPPKIVLKVASEEYLVILVGHVQDVISLVILQCAGLRPEEKGEREVLQGLRQPRQADRC